MRLSSRRNDDADVIRARLRALLADREQAGGWVPEEEGDEDSDAPLTPPSRGDGNEPEEPADLPASLGRHRAPGPTARWDPGARGARALWLAALAAALLVAAWTWLQRPTVEIAPQRAAPTSAERNAADGEAVGATSPAEPSVGEVAETSSTVVVAVVGPVERPGLVVLPTGSRVADAVEAAGGFLPEAEQTTVNLAAVVVDGQQILVGRRGQGAPSPWPAGGATATPAAGGPLNLNTASEAELDELPGLGPVLAQRIVEFRTQEGGFRSVDQLEDVPGIGPATFAEIRELVTV